MRGMAPEYRTSAMARHVLAVALLGATLTNRTDAQSAQAIDMSILSALQPASHVLVDVRISDDVHATMVAFVPVTGGLFVPLTQLMTFAGVRVRSRFGVISASGKENRPRFVLPADHASIIIGTLSVPLVPGDIYMDGTTVNVSTELAERLLDVEIDVDVMGAMVLLRNAGHLPSARRFRAVAEAKQTLAHRLEEARVPMLANRYRASIQSDYDLFFSRSTQFPGPISTSERSSAWTAALQARVAGRIAGGNLVGRVSTSSASGSVRDVQWTRYRPASSRLTRVILGALDAGGLTGSRVQGVSLDNQPVDYSEHRTIRVRGRAEPGWEYTVRQGNAWTGDDRPGDGSYEFRLPMIGDVARVDVFGWGPDGQERRYTRSVHAVPMRVQKGEFQYATAAGRCANAQQSWYQRGDARMSGCRWFGTADARVGLTDWLVMRTGIDAVPGTMAPYVGGAAVVRGVLTVQASHTVAAPSISHGAFSAQFEPSPAFSASIARSTAITGLSTQLASIHFAPIRWDGRFGVDGWLSQSSGLGVPTDIGRVGLMGVRNGVRLELFGSRTRIGTGSGASISPAFQGNAIGAEVSAAPAWLRIPRVQRTWLSGSAERATNGVVRSTLRIDGSVPRAFVEFSRTFASARDASRWSITVTPRSRRARQSTTYARSGSGDGSDGGSALLHRVSGNATWEAQRRGLSFSQDQATNRGSIVGHAFLDLDQNDRRDPGEPFVAHVPVIVANRALTTDSSGRFRSDHMTVTELIDVAVDSTALPSPCWRAGAPRWRVRASEGEVIDVNLPIRRGGILEGRIIRSAASGEPVADGQHAWDLQPQLTVVSVTTGESFNADVFGAGTFYLLGIPFGEYDILMPTTDQRRLGVVVRPVRVSVASSPLDDTRDAEAHACPLTTAIVRAVGTAPADNRGPSRSRPTDDVTVETTTAPRGLADSVITARRIDSLADSSVARETTVAVAEAGRDRGVPHVVAPSREYARKSRRALRAYVGKRRIEYHVRDARSRLGGRGKAERFVPICDSMAGRFNLNSGNFTLLGCQTDAWRRESPDGRPVPRPHL